MDKEVEHITKWHDDKVTHVLCKECHVLKEVLLFKRRESAAQLNARGYSGRHQIYFISNTCDSCWKARPRKPTSVQEAKHKVEVKTAMRRRITRSMVRSTYSEMLGLLPRLRAMRHYFQKMKQKAVADYYDLYVWTINNNLVRLQGMAERRLELPSQWQSTLNTYELERLHAAHDRGVDLYPKWQDKHAWWAATTPTRAGIRLTVSPLARGMNVVDARIYAGKS